MIIPELNALILSQWETLFPKTKKPDQLHHLGIPGSIEGGTTTFLSFGEKSSQPYFAVKIHRDPNEDEKVSREIEVLKFIHQLDAELSKSAPRLIMGKKIAGLWVTLQSILEGAPMVASLDDQGLPDSLCAEQNFTIISHWLLKLQKDSSQKIKLNPEDIVSRGKTSLDFFANTFPLNQDEKDFLVLLGENLDRLAKLGHTVQHGDFCRQNILINPSLSQPNVIDWTDSRLGGFPLHDLLFFITSYCLQVRKEAGINGFTGMFKHTYLSENPYSHQVKQCLVNYCQQTGIDLKDVPLLLGIFIVNQSLFEYQKVSKSLKEGGALPRFTFYLASLEKRSFEEATREQLWIYFFRSLVKKQTDFLRL